MIRGRRQSGFLKSVETLRRLRLCRFLFPCLHLNPSLLSSLCCAIISFAEYSGSVVESQLSFLVLQGPKQSSATRQQGNTSTRGRSGRRTAECTAHASTLRPSCPHLFTTCTTSTTFLTLSAFTTFATFTTPSGSRAQASASAGQRNKTVVMDGPSLNHIINNIVLPLRLPQTGADDAEDDRALLEYVIRTAQAYVSEYAEKCEDQHHARLWQHPLRMLRNMLQIAPLGAISAERLLDVLDDFHNHGEFFAICL